jgi:glycosyltransferase involved in cell wall biosynthesis
MKIGIDVSQLAFENTGVANYLKSLLTELVKNEEHEFVLFYSSLRRPFEKLEFGSQNLDSNVKIKKFKLPPSVLNIIWNKLHIMPIENFIGDVDIFITSDWTEPPTKKAKKATILYDLIVYRYPKETAKSIVEVQKRKLKWVKKEADIVFCISEATKKDVIEILKIPEDKLRVIYPGLTL